MRKLIVVLFITPTSKVLLKTKEINKRKFLVLFEAWQKRGESIYGTVARIVKEVESFAPPQTFRIKFEKLKEVEMNTRFGKVKKIYYVCYLPFTPIIEGNSEVMIAGKEKLITLRKQIPREQYLIILEVIGTQKSLTDFL